jgi:undecaprenyl-phosphate galactose phosphotransferase/putative colanic acid biosynthesis UDP-glucose lipid carrier transferase
MSVLQRASADVSARRELSDGIILHNSFIEELPKSETNVGLARFITYDNIGLLAAAVDTVIITASCLIATVAYQVVFLSSIGDATWLLAIGAHSSLLFVLVTKARGLYRTAALLSKTEQRNGLVSSWTMTLLIITALLFLLKLGGSYSRGSVIGFSVIALGLMMGWRSLLRTSLNHSILRGTLAGPRAVVIGGSEELSVLSALDVLQKYGMREVGRFEFSRTANFARERDVVNAAIAAARATNAEQVLLALSWADTRRRDFLSEKLRVLPLQVRLLPDQAADLIFSRCAGRFGSEILFDLQQAPLSRFNLASKRVMDVIMSIIALLILLPLFLLVSVAIKLDSPGPILFRQSRRGFNGKDFKIYKFRSMTVLEDGQTISQARRGDHRITRVGRMLRAASIDELPQLFNVLRGEMSLVGPRPHAIAHDNEYTESIANYAFRHHVKPGITGWAQVHGFRGETAKLDLMKKRVELDIWYINNWSLWLDLWIILMTCFEVARGRNAY